MLVRGTIGGHQIDALRKRSNVLEVYADTEIEPFDFAINSRRCEEFWDDSSFEDEFLCPIPPPDCNPNEHHGCLVDAANYLGADQIWQNGIKGEGIIIGIVDGGITAEVKLDRDTPGLVPRVVGGWPETSWGTIARWDGHGNKAAIDALGMAPRAEIYDIRISNGNQFSGAISDAIAGLNWAIEKYRRDGTPQILSCGWGLHQRILDPVYATDPKHPLTRKVVEAIEEGILVVFAAGNGGCSCPLEICGDDVGPGKSIWGANGHPQVLTVGAVNIDEQWIGYSSQGPAALDEYKPDVCGISHFMGYNSCDSGTSTACAVTAGVLALLKQSRPTLTQEAAKRLLKSTAKDIGPPGWDRHSGSGIIQAKSAYDEMVGRSSQRTVDAGQVERLELENQYLRELFIELALERRLRAGTPE
jgi:serine protease AprX